MSNGYANLTPAMAQYMKIKEANKDYLVFYRMGDFYELFFDDALVASKALDIALTKRGKAEGQNIPMCGVPFHAYENYMARLIHQGYKVAICEQMESPEEARKRGAKSVVQRDVIRLVTPGTLTEDNLLDARKNNYLLCCNKINGSFGFAWLDLSTGDFFTKLNEVSGGQTAACLQSFLTKINPVEIIAPDSMMQTPDLFHILNLYREKLTVLPQARFNAASAKQSLEKMLKVKTLDAFGNFSKPELAAAGTILDYVENTQKGKMPRIKKPIKISDAQCMEIDNATRNSLEIFESVNGDKKNSLLGTIDRTITGAGARLLAYRLNNPSLDINEINRRLDLADFFINIPEIRTELREYFRDFADLERAVSRLSLGRGGPKDMAMLGITLSFIPKIKNLINAYGKYNKLIAALPDAVSNALAKLRDFSPIVDNIGRALLDVEDLPILARDGGFIREGYYPALDEIKNMQKNSRELINALEQKYIQETGISNLKIRYNNVLGYFIEIPAKFAKDILQNPQFIHRQSVLNASRFVTVELTDLEKEIRSASEKSVAMEVELFAKLTEDILCASDDISVSAGALAELDVAAATADLAVEEQYCRPILDNSTVFEIKNGRHPVVELALKKEKVAEFVGNDCSLNGENNRIWLLTGPNMAGKSTFLRQNAIIAIMAQTGFYVPCTAARIGIIDKVFSRVGASDDLSRGRSTFMVEMVETAAILNQATPRSFVILDEIGRGTATYDGLSIAWAVVEHLHEVNRCRALFATHYHELTALTEKLDALSLHCMKIKEFNDEVIFMHEVIVGTADRSYGIHVAKLAGLPELVLQRAKQVLTSLENSQNTVGSADIEAKLPLFSDLQQQVAAEPKPSELEIAMQNLNPDELTPREALDKLYELKKIAAK